MLKLKKFLVPVAIIMIGCILMSCTSGGNGKSGEERLELTVWNTQGTDYMGKELKRNIVEEWLVNKTNVKVSNIYGNDGGQWDAKLTKLVATGNMPDVVVCQAGQGATHFAKLDSMQLIKPLTKEMIKEHAPEVWNRTPESAWDRISAEDGRILGIPYELKPSEVTLPNIGEEELDFIYSTKVSYKNDITAQATGALFIRDDILKKLVPEAKSYDELVTLLEEKNTPIGEDMLNIPIFSTQEYIDFMYKISDMNLTENGKKVYAFGYSGGDLWESLTYLGAEMYGYKTHNYTATWNWEKRRIEVPLVEEIVRSAAKTQNKMLADRVIDPESLAQTLSQFEQKVLGGQYAICAAQMLGDIASINKQLEDAGKSYRFVPFWTQVPAQKGYEAYTNDNLFSSSLCFTTNLSDEEMIQVLKWINVQYTDEYEQIKCWGPESEGLYTENADGTRTFKDERFTKYYVEKDKSALSPDDTLGIQGPSDQGYQVGGLFGVSPVQSGISKWLPEVMARKESFVPNCASGFRIPHTSEHVKNVKTSPQSSPWAAEYSEIKEVVDYWGARGQWESFFKTSLASDVDQFDANWDDAIRKLNEIVDIKTMTDKMTEIALPLAEQIEAAEQKGE